MPFAHLAMNASKGFAAIALAAVGCDGALGLEEANAAHQLINRPLELRSEPSRRCSMILLQILRMRHKRGFVLPAIGA